MTPELQLWLAVLERAVRDAELLFDRAKADPSVIDDHLFYQDYLSLCRYFRSRTNRIGGVKWICELVDFHPDNVSVRVEREFFGPIAEMMKMRRQQKRLLEILKNRISILEENTDAKECDETENRKTVESGEAESKKDIASTFIKSNTDTKTCRNDTRSIKENLVAAKVMIAIKTRKPIRHVAKSIYSAIRYDNEFFDIREKRKKCPVDRSLLGYWKVIDTSCGSEIVPGSNVAPDGYVKTKNGFIRKEQGERNV